MDLEMETFATPAKLKLHMYVEVGVCVSECVVGGCIYCSGVGTTTVIEPRHQQPTSRYKDISYTNGQNKKIDLRSVWLYPGIWGTYLGYGVADMPKRNEIIKSINNSKYKYIYGNGSAKKKR